MPIKRIQQTVPLRILDWQRCVGLFLEGFSLLCELHGAQVPEGRVEPLVVVPPHVPVDVRAQLLHVRVDCFASIFLKQFLHYFSAAWAAGFQQELHHMTAQTRTGTGPPCLYIPET